MRSLFSLIRNDLRSMVVDRGGGKLKYGLSLMLKVVLYPRIRVVLLFRFSHFFYQRRLGPLAYWLQAVGLKTGGSEIHPAAQIGPGFCLIHSNGVVIGHGAIVGRDFKCFHGVTLGDSGKGDGQPVLGDRVTASAGSKLLGGIHIGDGAVIGANAVVLKDVPAGGVAVGIPARVIRVNSTSPPTSSE